MISNKEDQSKSKKVFTVIKNYYHYNILKKVDNIPINDLGNIESENVEEKPFSDRLSAESKVNFTKLTNQEKDERLKNLARLIKQLRKKLRKVESQPQDKNEGNLVDSFLKANKYLLSYENFSSEDHRKVLENLIDLISNKKLALDSIYFKKIAKQVKRCKDKSSLSISDPHSIDNSLESNTVSTYSSASISNTQKLENDIPSTLNCFEMLPKCQQNQNPISLNANTNNLYTSSNNELNTDYIQYYNYFLNLFNSAKGFSVFNLNQQLINTLFPYQSFTLPF